MSSLLSKSDIFSSEVFLVLTSTKRKGLCASKGQIFFYFWALLTFGVVDIICHVPSERSSKIKQYDNVILRERVHVQGHDSHRSQRLRFPWRYQGLTRAMRAEWKTPHSTFALLPAHCCCDPNVMHLRAWILSMAPSWPVVLPDPSFPGENCP